jgi:hypothetical protein
MPADPGSVEQPRHPLHALTTYELADYRRQLDSAIAFFDTKEPIPSERDRLQARLEAVIAEQDDRTRLATRA